MSNGPNDEDDNGGSAVARGRRYKVQDLADAYGLTINQALDLIYDNLRNGTPLPPSQVVRTVPRGGTPGAAPPITLANVPPIAVNPPLGNQITFNGNILTIPD